MKFFILPIPVFTRLWYLAVDDTLQHDAANATSKTSFIAVYMWVAFSILDSTLAAETFFLAGGFLSSLY